jgi:uncharacterized protein with NRDE domain
VTPAGRFVAVTNQRVAAPPVPGARSRGHAVRDALGAPDVHAYVSALDPRDFASMNLVYGDATALRVAYFRHAAGTVEIESLAPGVHVLCNDRLGAPGFPRGVRLAAAMAPLADAPYPILRATVAEMLGDHERTPIDDGEAIPAWLSRDIVEAVTSVCIHSPSYGTKSSAIVALAGDRVVQYLHAEGPPCTAPFVDYTHLVAVER